MKLLLSTLFLAVALHAQGGAVEGRVVSATDGAPIRKADVLLRAAALAADPVAGPARASYLTRTDSSGRFSVLGVAPGSYECAASRAGFGAVAPDRFATVAATPRIEVGNGARVADVVLRLTPLGVIAGRVLDGEGYPVSGASVWAMQYGYQQGRKVLVPRGLVHSDDRGEYRLYDLFPGTYYPFASKEPAGSWPVARALAAFRTGYHPASPDAAQASPVEVAAAAETRSIDIRLQPLKTFSISGKWPGTSSLGRGASFTLTAQRRPPDPDSPENFGVTTSSNTWKLADVPPGSYEVRMTGRDPSAGAFQVARALVDVVDADVDGVDLSFSPGPAISFAVKPANTITVALDSLRVTLVPVEGGQQYAGRLKADGTSSTVGVFPGVYGIVVEPAEKVYPKSIKLGDRELADRRVDLTGGGGGVLAIVVAADFATVQGTVTDAGGSPAAGQNVTLIPDQTQADWKGWFRETLTGQDGRFAIRGVAPGRYTAFAWQDAPRGAPESAEFRRPFEPLGLAVTVAPASQQTIELKAIIAAKQ